jgi:hypothetical protein
MPRRRVTATLITCAVLAAGGAAWFWARPSRRPPAPSATGPALPTRVAAWTAQGQAVSYDPQTIFSYIDGHAEVYLAYGMRRCLARRYTGPSGERDIVLDVFELASPEDAYGVLTYDRDGAPADVGHDALYRHGWLRFRQGRYFVSALAEQETGPAKAAVFELARGVSAALPGDGGVPGIVAALPAEGLQADQVRYLHHPQILNTHVWLDDANVLDLGPDVRAALGRYRRDGVVAHLLLADYPGPDAAARAAGAFARRFGLALDVTDSVKVPDRGWFGVGARGARLAAVIAAGSQELTAVLMRDALQEPKEASHGTR